MPFAHPQQVTINRNYSEPVASIAFATSRPGEDVADFDSRRVDRGPWGGPGRGRHGAELSFTRESAEELLEMLVSVVGVAKAREMVDAQ